MKRNRHPKIGDCFDWKGRFHAAEAKVFVREKYEKGKQAFFLINLSGSRHMGSNGKNELWISPYPNFVEGDFNYVDYLSKTKWEHCILFLKSQTLFRWLVGLSLINRNFEEVIPSRGSSEASNKKNIISKFIIMSEYPRQHLNSCTPFPKLFKLF